MSLLTLTLKNFSKLVPACDSRDMELALKTLRSGQHDAVVIVGEGYSPLGVIYCRHLMSYLMAASNSEPSSSPIEIQSLVEPITTLPAQTSVREFWDYVQTGHEELLGDRACALVDSQHQFLGLLNPQKLLQSWFFTQNSHFHELVSEQPLQICQQPLFQLLEQLPIPAQLQTAQKQSLYQNLAWREQVGEISVAQVDSSINQGDQVPIASSSVVKEDEALQIELTQSKQIPSFGRGVSSTPPYCLKASLCLDTEVSPARFKDFASQLLTTQIRQEAVEADDVQPTRATAAATVALAHSKSSTERVWQFVKLPLKFFNSQASAWLIIATDVTEHQRLCQELAAKNADLVQLNRLKDEFLACISHELKSPLTAVVGLSSLLKEEKLGQLNQRQARYAKLIYRSGYQLMTLVNDLLDLTRLETGQLQLTLKSVQVKSVCWQAYATVQDKQQGKSERQLQFSLDLDPDLEIIVADELRLRQMLVHLLDNAFKFTQANGEVGLKVSRWKNWIAFTVWDTGIGIPGESQHLIFQKFQQLEDPLTRQFEGAGLGLVLTQRLARAHGGDISFISKAGQGSQFTILLPPNPHTRNEASLKSERLVLLVEAIPCHIDSLTSQLEELGYRAVIARSGTEALEKARQLQPQAILLDPLLPLLSGWDVLTLLKSDARTRDIQTLILTSSVNQEQAEQSSANGTIQLPVNKQLLQELLAAGENPLPQPQKLTILHLHAQLDQTNWFGLDAVALDEALKRCSSGLAYRLLEADSLEQAEILTRVWQVDAVVLDAIAEPQTFLCALAQCDRLSALPLVTLDAQTTEAANAIGSLLVFPCLFPPERQNLDKLPQAIQIATKLNTDTACI